MAKNQNTESVATPAETVAADTAAATPAPAVHAKFDYTKLNTLAVVSLATSISWVGAVAGVITGHIALAQIKRSGEQGRALAVTGLVLGYLYIAGSLALGALSVLFRLRGWVGGDVGFDHNGFAPGMMNTWQNH